MEARVLVSHWPESHFLFAKPILLGTEGMYHPTSSNRNALNAVWYPGLDSEVERKDISLKKMVKSKK